MKLKTACLGLVSITLLTCATLPRVIYAQGGAFEEIGNDSSETIEDTANAANPTPTQESADVAGTGSDDLDKILNTIINGLSALVGLVVIISLIVAGIQYMTARDNASQVSAAKGRIVMTLLSLFLFMMGYSLLQWLIPGGIF